jgi:predicted component of type VI protein secretion system
VAATALDHRELVERIEAIRDETLGAVEDVFRFAFERPVSERFAVATALMQEVAEDLAVVQELVARPRPRPELRVLDGGREPVSVRDWT